MPDKLPQFTLGEFLPSVLIVLCIALIGWYLVQREIERQRAFRLARLAAEVLRPIGTEGSFHWLGAGRCELRLSQTRAPFTSFRVIIWLQSRALLPVWLFERWRGRRDVIAFAADLTTRPLVQFEVFDPESSVGKRALQRATSLGWETFQQTIGGESLCVATPNRVSAQRVIRKTIERSPFEGVHILRLAATESSPNLNLTVDRPEALLAMGGRFPNWFGRLANAVESLPA